MSIERKFKMALDETRLLMLGSQILFGFQFNAVFHEGFEDLPQSSRRIDALALMLITISIAFLIAPSAQNRLTDDGQITGRVWRAITTFAGAALFPFACALGLDMYIAVAKIEGSVPGVLAGLFFAMLALLFWYVLELGYRKALRRDGSDMGEKEPARHTPLEARIEQMLTESRIVIPGAQALLGFQLIAVVSRTFSALPAESQIIHALALAATAVALILLIAPAAFHRITFQGQDSERFFRLGSALVTAALLPLALGISGDVYVAVARIANAAAIGAAAAALSLIMFMTFWYVQPLILRGRRG
jgi:hypothetical protein